MPTVNPAPLLLWPGVALIAFDHFGLTAAGISLIAGTVISAAVSQNGGETCHD